MIALVATAAATTYVDAEAGTAFTDHWFVSAVFEWTLGVPILFMRAVQFVIYKDLAFGRGDGLRPSVH